MESTPLWRTFKHHFLNVTVIYPLINIMALMTSFKIKLNQNGFCFFPPVLCFETWGNLVKMRNQLMVRSTTVWAETRAPRWTEKSLSVNLCFKTSLRPICLSRLKCHAWKSALFGVIPITEEKAGHLSFPSIKPSSSSDLSISFIHAFPPPCFW